MTAGASSASRCAERDDQPIKLVGGEELTSVTWGLAACAPRACLNRLVLVAFLECRPGTSIVIVTCASA
jgi:hypothetical protein